MDAPVRATLGELAFRGPDLAQVDALCAKLGIEGLRDRIRAWSLGLGLAS